MANMQGAPSSQEKQKSALRKPLKVEKHLSSL